MKYMLPRRRVSASPIIVTLMMALAVASSAAPLPAQGVPPAQRDYTQADVDFTQGMILHHAQAVVMSDWAPSHGARRELQTLCKRIALSQRDEITMMQSWLQERHLPTPDPLHMLKGAAAGSHATPAAASAPMQATHDMSAMNMPGMEMRGHSAMMPGMLTPAEMHQLDAARDTAFDRLFLTSMIKHHEGALGMVATLFATPGAGQQADLFSFATDVDAGQRVEMARMQAMLNTLTPSQTK
jgi:uncharacterized protein (DUF305 family)